MSANYRASVVGWPALPLASRRGLNPNLAALRSAASALHRGRRLLETLDRAWRKRFAGNGGPQMPPEDRPTSDSIWDDPMLWMLMMH
jgi:hypothetical protein